MESIFTGLNNFKVLSIIDTRFDEQFGFTNEEVKQLLKSYDLESHFEETKEWYDGYRFGNADWLVRSNVEAGEGFADIVVETEDPDAGIIFELKCSKDAAGLENACQRAMEQIKDRRYTEYLKNDGRDDILIYGIAFYKKRCKVVVEKI